MIKLADSSIMLLGADGVLNAFEADQLQAKIIRSFMLAGIRDVWLAEDIALAVESALEHDLRENKVFAVSEINATVIRILEHSGFPEAAENYRRGNPATEITLDAELGTVATLIRRHLGLNGQTLENLADKVTQAARQLNIHSAAPALYLELAKYFQTGLMSADSLNAAIAELPAPAASPWIVSLKELDRQMSAPGRALVERKIMVFSGISRLFPAIKAVFKISGLVEMRQLPSPLTEMAMAPHFHDVAQTLNEALAIAQTAFKASGEKTPDNGLPVVLTVPDMSIFAQKHLEASWPQAAGDCREMLGYLEKMVNTAAFKVKMA